MIYNVRKEVLDCNGRLVKSTSFTIDLPSASDFMDTLGFEGYLLNTDEDFFKSFYRISSDKHYLRYIFRKVNG